MIEIRCKGSQDISLDKLDVIQGELKSLSKENYEKLKKSLLETGFIAPFFVWEDEKRMKLLDGTQRFRTLHKMRQEGIALPEKFPCVVVQAKDQKEAYRHILAISSQYGTISTDSVYEFAELGQIQFGELNRYHFDAFDWSEYKLEFMDEEVPKEPKEEKVCPHCGEPLS